MAEQSFPWPNATGDGGPYTHDQLREWLWTAFDDRSGVVRGQLSDLLVSSTGANNITVAAGRALVDGTRYHNTAPISITSSSPSIGTTGRRVVLRKTWATQIVRAVILSSSDGVASLPALTQTDGVTWEYPLASFTITTAGAITLTDARTYLVPVDHSANHITGGGDIIPTATSSTVGLMSASDKSKLDGISSGGTNTPLADAAASTMTAAAQTSTVGTSGDAAREDHVHGHPVIPALTATAPVAITPATAQTGNAGASTTDAARRDHVHAQPGHATTGAAGFMSAADKTKLDSLLSGGTVKAWGRVTAAGSLQSGNFGVSNVNKTGTGTYTLTLSSSVEALVITGAVNNGSELAYASISETIGSSELSSVEVRTYNTSLGVADAAFSFIGMGT